MTKQQLIKTPKNTREFSNEFKAKCDNLKLTGKIGLIHKECIKHVLENGGFPFKGKLYNEQNTEKETFEWLLKIATEIEADAKDLEFQEAEKKEAEKKEAEKKEAEKKEAEKKEAEKKEAEKKEAEKKEAEKKEAEKKEAEKKEAEKKEAGAKAFADAAEIIKQETLEATRKTLADAAETARQETDAARKTLIDAAGVAKQETLEATRKTLADAAETARQETAAARKTLIDAAGVAKQETLEATRKTLADAAETARQETAAARKTLIDAAGVAKQETLEATRKTLADAAETAKQETAAARKTLIDAAGVAKQETLEATRKTLADAAETVKQETAAARKTLIDAAGVAKQETLEATRKTLADAAETAKQEIDAAQKTSISDSFSSLKLAVTQGMIDENFIYADFIQKYQHGNSLLHRIFSWGKEEQSASAINRLEELLNNGEMSTDNLQNTFEAKNDEGLTPLEAALLKNSTKVGDVFKSTKTLEVLRILLSSKGKDGSVCYVAGKYLDGYNQELFYKEMKNGISYLGAWREWLGSFVPSFIWTSELVQNKQKLVEQCYYDFAAASISEIRNRTNVLINRTEKSYIKEKVSTLYGLINTNAILKKGLIEIVYIKTGYSARDVYPDRLITDRLKLEEEDERLKITSLSSSTEDNTRKATIESVLKAIGDLKTTYSAYGLLPSNFGSSVLKAAKLDLKVVFSNLARQINATKDSDLKEISKKALDNIKTYESIYLKEGFDNLEQDLKAVINTKVSCFLQSICGVDKKTQAERRNCSSKIDSLNEQYNFLGTKLFFTAKNIGKENLQCPGQDLERDTKSSDILAPKAAPKAAPKVGAESVNTKEAIKLVKACKISDPSYKKTPFRELIDSCINDDGECIKDDLICVIDISNLAGACIQYTSDVGAEGSPCSCKI